MAQVNTLGTLMAAPAPPIYRRDKLMMLAAISPVIGPPVNPATATKTLCASSRKPEPTGVVINNAGKPKTPKTTPSITLRRCGFWLHALKRGGEQAVNKRKRQQQRNALPDVSDDSKRTHGFMTCTDTNSLEIVVSIIELFR